MYINVKQGSKEWHQVRSTRIGSSEIFGLIKYYITEQELLNVGVNPDNFTEKPYVSAFQLYHKIKNPELYIDEGITRENELFGHRIENLAFDLLNKEHNKDSKYIKGKVYITDNCVASLDIEAFTQSGEIIYDMNNFPINLVENPGYFIEIKGKYNDPNKPIDWRHIFQVQYAMKLSGYNWAKLLCISLTNDNQFERGYISALPKPKAFIYLKENAQMQYYIVKKREDYQLLIELALQRFFTSIALGTEPILDEVKGGEMIFKLVQQKGKVLGTDKLSIESPAVDEYLSARKNIQVYEDLLSESKCKILNMMLSSGKNKCISDKGVVSLNKVSLRCIENKKPIQTGLENNW